MAGARVSALPAVPRPAPWPRARRLLGALFGRPSSAFGVSVFLLFLAAALVGPWLAPYGPAEQLFEEAREPPSWSHPFGTDRLGRDVFSRVLAGARDIFALAGLGTLAALLLGTVVGLSAGYLGGWLDELTFRLFDSLLAVPALLLALLVLGTLGPSRTGILAVIAVAYMPIVARVVRSVALQVRAKAYVQAARLQGDSHASILLGEVLPAALPVLAVEGALRFSYAIFLVASLGFLGVGVQPPSPDWGLMVSEARNHVAQTPWSLYFPAAAISLLVIATNLAAEGLQRALTGAP